MKLFHSIKISVFLYPEEKQLDEEIEEKIKETLKKLMPIDIDAQKPDDKNKIIFKGTKVDGFENRTIKIFEIDITKESHTTDFWKTLKAKLNKDQLELLLRQKESRLDEDLNFFIRLGKQELLRNDYYLTDSGDCFHIKFSLAAFPKKRENALKVIEGMLKD